MKCVNLKLFPRLSNLFMQRTLSTQLNNSDVENSPHMPVMAAEAISYLKPSEGGTIIDMTFGAGGHTKQLLKYCPSLRIIALDRDPVAHKHAKSLCSQYPNQITPLLGRFSELPQLLSGLNISHDSIDGILFDFGCSSMQFDIAERGFSLSKDGPLDMRMDGDRFPENPTASDVLALADEEDLIKIFKIYGQEKQAKKIARAVVEARYMFKSFRSTKEFADFVSGVCEKEFRLDKIQRNAHIATKVFQALRIFVNNEINEINYGMIVAQKYLKLGGRVVAISFHSLEDTIVKRHILGQTAGNVISRLPQKYIDYGKSHLLEDVEEIMLSSWNMINKHVITPSEEEVNQNPRSRSAKLRAAVKIK